MVTVEEPDEREITQYMQFTGNVQSRDVVHIRARVSGYLMNNVKPEKDGDPPGPEIVLEEGSLVKKGQVLFQIDWRPFAASLAAAKAEVTRWDASVQKANADLARNEKLRPSGAISQEELEQSIAETKVAEASRLGAVEKVRAAQLDLDYSTITSPIDGRVGRREVDIGNLITVTDGESGILTTIVSLDPIYVYFSVAESTLQRARQAARDARRIAAGGSADATPENDDDRVPPQNIRELNIPVQVKLQSEDDFLHEGILDYIDNRVDPSTGTLMARATFENEDQMLVDGMFCRVRIPVGSPTKQLLVDELAIGVDQGQRYLYVVNADNEVEYRRVQPGARDGTDRVIPQGTKSDEGVKPGDRVIVNGAQRVRPGDKVRVQERKSTTDDSAE